METNPKQDANEDRGNPFMEYVDLYPLAGLISLASYLLLG
jgi:hypothetical protein